MSTWTRRARLSIQTDPYEVGRTLQLTRRPVMIPSRVLGSLIAAYAIAMVLLAPPVTHADSVDQPPTKTVRFDDLNLATSYGAETLFRRIQIAATAVCEE